MTYVKPAPVNFTPYKPKLRQHDLNKLIRLLDDYRKYPHFSMRDEIIELVDNLRLSVVEEVEEILDYSDDYPGMRIIPQTRWSMFKGRYLELENTKP